MLIIIDSFLCRWRAWSGPNPAVDSTFHRFNTCYNRSFRHDWYSESAFEHPHCNGTHARVGLRRAHGASFRTAWVEGRSWVCQNSRRYFRCRRRPSEFCQRRQNERIRKTEGMQYQHDSASNYWLLQRLAFFFFYRSVSMLVINRKNSIFNSVWWSCFYQWWQSHPQEPLDFRAYVTSTFCLISYLHRSHRIRRRSGWPASNCFHRHQVSTWRTRRTPSVISCKSSASSTPSPSFVDWRRPSKWVRHLFEILLLKHILKSSHEASIAQRHLAQIILNWYRVN